MQDWLDRLGYTAEPAVLHRRGEAVPEPHPYALEIKALLRPDGAIRAQALFDVEGVPTVVFVGDDDEPLSKHTLDEVRKRIWNQNLASVVIEVKGKDALALPARKLRNAGEQLLLESGPAGWTFLRPRCRVGQYLAARAELVSTRMRAWTEKFARKSLHSCFQD